MNVAMGPDGRSSRPLAEALRAGDPGPQARVAVADLLDALDAVAWMRWAARPLADGKAAVLLEIVVGAVDETVSQSGLT